MHLCGTFEVEEHTNVLHSIIRRNDAEQRDQERIRACKECLKERRGEGEEIRLLAEIMTTKKKIKGNA